MTICTQSTKKRPENLLMKREHRRKVCVKEDRGQKALCLRQSAECPSGFLLLLLLCKLLADLPGDFLVPVGAAA